jgi:adenylate cyclase
VEALSSPPRASAWWRWIATVVLALVAGGAYVALRGRVQAPPGRGEQAAADGAGKSVAVLPFVNVGGRPEEEYFADGMTDELAGALGTVPGLRVASRTSSFAFKGKSEDVREIGRRLHVGSVLEGSVRHEGRRLRVRAQLTDVADGLALWSDTYEREAQEVFQVQEEIARAIAGALRVRLAGNERLVRGGTEDVEAHDLYLRGRFFALKFTEPDLRRALELYQQALARDSTYAPAWAGVADAWTYLADDWVAPRDAYPKAKAAARKALALDLTLAEAHGVLGITLCYMWDRTGGERELRRALALNPNLAGAWSWYADVLLWRGAFDSAVAVHRRAIALDPLDPYYLGQLAWTLTWAGRLGEAVAAARKALELDPHYALAYIRLGYAQLAAGDPAAALEAFQRAPEFSDRAQAGMVVALAELGRTAEARRILADIEREAERRYVRGEGIAWAYLALGDRERAFRWLERAYADRSAGLTYAERDPRWAPIRDDPRFVALLRKLRPW